MPLINGQMLREARKRKGFKVGAFAERLGVSAKHLHHVEAETSPASEEMVYRAANELGIDPEPLFRRTEAGAA